MGQKQTGFYCTLQKSIDFDLIEQHFEIPHLSAWTENVVVSSAISLGPKSGVKAPWQDEKLMPTRPETLACPLSAQKRALDKPMAETYAGAENTLFFTKAFFKPTQKR
jgi:hypothetical protein